MDVASKLASLREEVEVIHFANKLYWAQKEHSHMQPWPNTNGGRSGWIRSVMSLKEMQEN
jgi:hypothetical protein